MIPHLHQQCKPITTWFMACWVLSHLWRLCPRLRLLLLLLLLLLLQLFMMMLLICLLYMMMPVVSLVAAMQLCACFSAANADSPCLPCAESGPTMTHLPFQSDCCQIKLARYDILSSSLAEKILLFQSFGSQFDVPLKDMHLHAQGVPAFDPSCPSVCGHQHPDHDGLPPKDASALPSTADEPVANNRSNESPVYMGPSEEYVLCHLTWDQLHILWHQCLGHLHSHHVHWSMGHHCPL